MLFMFYAGVRLLQKMGWRPGKGIGTASVSMEDFDEDDGRLTMSVIVRQLFARMRMMVG